MSEAMWISLAGAAITMVALAWYYWLRTRPPHPKVYDPERQRRLDEVAADVLAIVSTTERAIRAQKRIDDLATVVRAAGLQWDPVVPVTGVWFREGARVLYQPETDTWLVWRGQVDDAAEVPSMADAVAWLDAPDEPAEPEPEPDEPTEPVTQRISARFTETQWEWLKDKQNRCRQEGREVSLAELLREIVDERRTR